MLSSGALAISLLAAGIGYAASPDSATSPIVERVGDTVYLQIEANSFNSLTPKQQALAYWLSQAAIAISPIIYDQQSRFGLRQKALLEAVVANNSNVDPAVYSKILDYTKLFWTHRGNHNSYTAQKFLPTFTPEELNRALTAVGRADLLKEEASLQQSLFDPGFEPSMTTKSPKNGLDILQASSNNFYLGVTLEDLKGFTEKYALNSRLVKQDGKLIEQVYRAGTPDGKVAPGLYAEYLKKANSYLAKARSCAEPEQAKVIGDLIHYYQTGEFQDWLQFDRSWVRNNSPVDFVNGFIGVYRDARGVKATSRSVVSITDAKLSGAMSKIAGNAQYFEDRAPWPSEYKKQGVAPPIALAVESVAETGYIRINITGLNLPDENEISEKIGTKNFFLMSNARALDGNRGTSVFEEFAPSPAEIVRHQKYGETARELVVSLHEVIGHASGRVSPRITQSPQVHLKEYYSALEEARANRCLGC